MKKKELDNFIIESFVDIDYYDELIDYIIANEKNIFDFFGLNNLQEKCTIKIMEYESFREYLKKCYGRVYDYIRGTTDGRTKTIRILSVDDQRKYTTHKNSTIEETFKMLLHEIVHICHDAINDDYNQTIWFREGIATNLSGQKYNVVDLTNCDFEVLKNDFLNFGSGNYNAAYTIVNYILKNYEREKLLKLVRDSEYLRKESNKIFEEAKSFFCINKKSQIENVFTPRTKTRPN